MTRSYKLFISFIIIAGLGSLSSVSMAANRTPGDDKGSDHTAYYFGPYDWSGFNKLPAYQMHVCSGGGKGQQYAASFYQEGVTPNTNSTVCTIATFYDIVHNNNASLATLLIDTHGASGVMSIESFAKTPAGRAARDVRYTAYINGNGTGIPALTTSEIGAGSTHDSHCIMIYSAFITNRANIPDSLVYNSSCSGASVNGAWVGAGSRVSLGYSGTVYSSVARAGVKTFFSRMDGQDGIAKRPVSKARQGVAQLAASGNEATTLAPAVLQVDAPCPISVGDKVTYTLDTECEQNLPGDIVGQSCTIENEIWLTKTTLQGTCTAVVGDGSFYNLTLKWLAVFSDWNTARLDGNTVPPVNAKGKAHDDHKTWYLCPVYCIGDYDQNGLVDISDLLWILDNWSETGIDALLAALDNWGTTCSSGACCVDGYCMESTSPDDCYEWGGLYQGDDSTCDSSYCSLSGACCFPPYDCVDDFPEQECYNIGGQFLGTGSSCDGQDCWSEPIGACCHGDGTCTSDVISSNCQEDGDYFMGPYSTCDQCGSPDPVGACCIDLGSGSECIEMSEMECTTTGGYFHGDDIICEDSFECAPVGACCVPVDDTPSCIDSIPELWCIDNGATWYEGQTCDDIGWDCSSVAIGACCLSDGTCVDAVGADECETLGGLHEPNLDCGTVSCDSSIGACCVELNCWVMTEVQCTGMGGQFLGVGTDCSGNPCYEPPATGACCVYDSMGGSSCWISNADECTASGGHYFGDGTECYDGLCDGEPVTGACCFLNGECMDDFDPAKCDAMGGDYSQGFDCNTVSCVPATGACCWTDGTCSDDVYPEDCAYSGGTFYGSTTCLNAPCAPPSGCPVGEVEDCNGNCAPANWIGDGICDDGAYDYNGVPIYFNCDQFDCDGGDCDNGFGVCL